MSDHALVKLSRSSQLRQLRGVALNALREYGIEPQGMRLMRYEDNAVYRVDAVDERYSLRLSLRGGRSVEEQKSELFWLERIIEDGAVSVPIPVRTSAGELVGEIGSRLLAEPATFVSFRWIPGRDNPSYGDVGIAEALGQVTARLHVHADIIKCPTGFTRPSWGVADLFDNGPAVNGEQACAMLGPEGVEVIRAVGAQIRQTLPPMGSDWGLIHADLHRENLIVTNGGTIAVIDFDDCGYGYYMLDIATVLSSVHRQVADDSAAYRVFASRYLDGYQQVRPLSPSFGRLENFLIMRDMVIVNFVTHSKNPTVGAWGPGRVRGIVEQLRRYVDGEPYAGALGTF
ncbi:MAG: phosphotransferase enzyme family protein [Pseudonocardiaceae bacterium]